ncbi:SDR family oxidoreductase [Streptomyces sp. NPDC051286]|uniref:SDR family oxidoreductase n=1 Tax=Streptomyces sp. NPDC051286 TaxID=3365647 RepID=UPI0037B5E822
MTITGAQQAALRRPVPEVAACARRMLDSTPWGHRGSPQDIAYDVLHLASEEARFVTGTELVADGSCTAV